MAGTVIGLLFWGLAIYVANRIGEGKNRVGLPWGLLLGWIGVLIVWMQHFAPIGASGAAVPAS